VDVIGSHAARLPALDGRWAPQSFEREELVRGLLEGGVAGTRVSHPVDNVIRNIRLLHEGDPDKRFGMTGLQDMDPDEVLALVGTAAGFDPADLEETGPVPVDPERVLDACAAVGDRLALAIERSERVVLATGHPFGLAHLYGSVGRTLRAQGAQVLRPADDRGWVDEDGDPRRIRYLGDVAMLTDDQRPRHTHSAEAMNVMLDDQAPDLVFADHGFAGAAIERGVETVSIADVNDPALLVAKAHGRTETVIVMDDNVAPDAYWPCFQAMAARLPGGNGPRGPSER
jgi:Phosphatase